MPKKICIIILFTSAVASLALVIGFFPGPAMAVTPTLVSVDSCGDALSRIDPVTGNVTLIGLLSLDPNEFTTPIAMAIRPIDNAIFVWNNSGTGGAGVLLRVDRNTGLATRVDPDTPDQGTLAALAFSPSGRLFGVDTELYDIDPSTGEKESIGSLGGGRRVAGADFSPDGILYGLTFDNELVTIDTDTGEASSVAFLDDEALQAPPGSIVFDPLGQLIGSGFFQFETLDDAIFNINQITGEITNIRILDPPPLGEPCAQGMGFVGVASLPEPEPFQPVPERQRFKTAEVEFDILFDANGNSNDVVCVSDPCEVTTLQLDDPELQIGGMTLLFAPYNEPWGGSQSPGCSYVRIRSGVVKKVCR